MSQPRKILSIDGGGIKGVYPAAFLADIEETLPEPIYKYFDLIVGTSTGGIIALGLGLGLKASEILKFYEDYGPHIFKGNRFYLQLKHFAWRRYGHEKLKESLSKTFGEKLLGDSKTRLVIPSMNIDRDCVHLFKTAHHPKFERDYKEKVVDVALATASAPTYFPIFRSSKDFQLIDGGVWANNPAGIAAVEAIGVLNWSKENTRILSIGCTEESTRVGWLRRNHITIPWAREMVNVFMKGQSSGSLGTAYSLLGHENVVRVNDVVPKGSLALDSPRNIPELRGLGRNRSRQESPFLKMMFFEETVQSFEPYQKLEV